MANDDVTTQGPLGSPTGQMLQKGMNFLFGKPKQPMGMVAPVAQQAVKPAQPATPAAPTALPQPSIDTRSGYNVNTYVDRMVEGK